MDNSTNSWANYDAIHNNVLEPLSAATMGDSEPDVRNAGKAPFGYATELAGKHPNPKKAQKGERVRRLVLVDEDTQTVSEIFSLFRQNKSFVEIKRHLDSQKRIGPGARRAADEFGNVTFQEWREESVKDILTNPRYTGYRFQKIKSTSGDNWVRSRLQTHPAIVTPEVFMAVHQILNEGRRIKRPRREPTLVLQSLVYCGRCGKKMAKYGSHSYRCQANPSNGKSVAYIHQEDIVADERELLPHVYEWLKGTFEPESITAMATQWAGETTMTAIKKATEEREQTSRAAREQWPLVRHRWMVPDVNKSAEEEAQRSATFGDIYVEMKIRALKPSLEKVSAPYTRATRTLRDTAAEYARLTTSQSDAPAWNAFLVGFGVRVNYQEGKVEVIGKSGL